MDTPGILWPKLENSETQLNLAFTGAIKDEIVDNEELALNLVKLILKDYPKKLVERYKVDLLDENAAETIDKIAKKRGTLSKGGEIDYNRVSNIILEEFRSGKIGQISLERPV